MSEINPRKKSLSVQLRPDAKTYITDHAVAVHVRDSCEPDREIVLILDRAECRTILALARKARVRHNRAVKRSKGGKR